MKKHLELIQNLADLNLQPGSMDKANNLHSIFERSTHHLQAPSIVCNMSRTPWLLGWLLIWLRFGSFVWRHSYVCVWKVPHFVLN